MGVFFSKTPESIRYIITVAVAVTLMVTLPTAPSSAALRLEPRLGPQTLRTPPAPAAPTFARNGPAHVQRRARPRHRAPLCGEDPGGGARASPARSDCPRPARPRPHDRASRTPGGYAEACPSGDARSQGQDDDRETAGAGRCPAPPYIAVTKVLIKLPLPMVCIRGVVGVVLLETTPRVDASYSTICTV